MAGLEANDLPQLISCSIEMSLSGVSVLVSFGGPIPGK